MEYNQLFQLHIPVNVHNIADIALLSDDLPAKILFQINIGQEDELREVSRLVFLSKKNIEFWIQLNPENTPKDTNIDNWLNNLTNLLCHLNYSTLSNKKLIGYPAEKEEGHKLIPQVKSFLQTQGFENIFFVPINKEAIIEEIGFIKIPSEDFLKEDAYVKRVLDIIKKSTYPLQVLSPNTQLQNAVNYSHFLNKLLATVLYQNGVNIDLLLKIYTQRRELDAFSKYNNDLNANLNTQNTYVDFLKSIIYGSPSNVENEGDKINQNDNFNFSETVKIKRFYHYEYEILPLWYKRFGHIIKVLMGKRSFRSLFDDNVNKYKD